MNELIEKLLDEAELDIVWDQDNPDYKWVEGSEESLLKFAELIVRECANQCDLLLDHKISSEWARGTHDCSKAIRKHFGVEE